MIQDLEGATSEPSRRRHVAVLSVFTAAVSLVLLYAFVAPAPRMDVPPMASPSASPAARMVVLSASDSTVVRFDPVAPLRDDETSTECAPVVGSSPPVHFLFDREGRLLAVYSSGKTGRFLPLPQAYVGSGWLTVPCDTSDVIAPRFNRAR